MPSSAPTRRPVAATLLTASALLGSAAVASGASLTDALDAAPADAELVIAFPSLQGFSEMVSRLATAAGLNDEGTDDVLGGFKRDFGLDAGIDDAGAGLIVFTGVGDAMAAAADRGGAAGEADAPGAFLVLPVTDYDAFVGGLEKPEGEVVTRGEATRVLLDGEATWVRKVGSHAVLSEEDAGLVAYAAADAAAAALAAMGGYAAEAGSPDAAAWVNVSAMRPAMEEAVDDMAAQLAGGRALAGGDAGAAFGRALVPLYADALRGLASSVDGLLLTARMTPDRVAIDAAARVKPGSAVAGYLTNQRTDALALLAGLPDDPFVTAQALDLTAIDVSKLTTALVDAAKRVAEGAGGAEGGGSLANAVSAMAEAWAATALPAEAATASAKVNYAGDPQAMMAGGLFQSLTATASDDPAALQAAFPQQIEAMKQQLAPALNDVMASVQALNGQQAGEVGAGAGAGAGAEEPELGIAVTGSHNPAAIVLAGVPVDQYQLSFALPPAALEAMGPAGFALGNAGMSGFAAATGGVFLQTASPQTAFMERAILASKADPAVPRLADSPSLAGVAGTLPEGLVSASYLSLQGVGEMYNAFLPFLGVMAPGLQPLEVPAGLAPLSLGVGMQPAGGDAAGGHDLGLRMNVPVPMIEFVRDTYAEMAPAAPDPAAGGGGADRGQGPPPAPF